MKFWEKNIIKTSVVVLPEENDSKHDAGPVLLVDIENENLLLLETKDGLISKSNE